MNKVIKTNQTGGCKLAAFLGGDMMVRHPVTAWVALVASVLFSFSAMGDSTWKAKDGSWSGNWSDEGHWDGGVPTSADIAIFPKGAKAYTVTVDGDVSCNMFRTEGGSGSGVITFTGGGSITCTVNAGGPSLNTYLGNGFEVTFTNITVTMPRFNPRGGILRVKNEANFTISSWFYSTSSSSVVVDGGRLTINNTLDIRGPLTLSVKRGELITTAGSVSLSHGDYKSGLTVAVSGGAFRGASFALASKPATVMQTGGVLELRNLPTGFDNAAVNIADGTLIVNGGSLNAVTHADWMPKKGKLILTNNEYTALTVPPDTTVSLDDLTIYITNNVAGHGPDAANYPGIYSNTNAVFTGSGELYANFLFVRGTCTVDVAKFCLGTKMHYTGESCVLWVPNGLVFGAYGDWSSVYNKAPSYYYGPITVETTDCFDGATPRTITFGRVVLNPGVDYLVTGCGTNAIETGQTRTWVNSLRVAEGATFRFIGCRGPSGSSVISTGTLSALNLTLDADSTLVTEAGLTSVRASAFEIDPAAKITTVIPSNITAGRLYPIITLPDPSATFPSVTLTGEGAAGWEVRSAAGTLYLADGTQTVTYPPSDSNVTNDWKGTVDGKFSTAGNWNLNTAPSSSTQGYWTNPAAVGLRFPGGTAQTVVTNDIADTDFGNGEHGLAVCGMQFLSSAAPYEVHGNLIRFCSQSYSTADSPIYSDSQFPVVFYAPVYRSGGKFGVVLHNGSYIQFMGEVHSSNADFYLRGDVRFGGEAKVKGIYFNSPFDGNPNRLTVLDGGKFYAHGNDGLLRTSASGATIDVRAGGSFAYDGQWIVGTKPNLTYLVDGRFAVSNTLISLKTAPFSGAGTVYLGGVAPSNATAQAKFEGNMRLEMGGDWQVVCAANPDTPFTLAVKSGNLTLAAAANWAYGVPDGVTSATSAEDRAMMVSEKATLTFGASAFTTTLRDPVVADGHVAFAPGTKIMFGGALLQAMRPRNCGWTTFATASTITGLPSLPLSFEMRQVENLDGTASLQARIRPGTVFLIR